MKRVLTVLLLLFAATCFSEPCTYKILQEFDCSFFAIEQINPTKNASLLLPGDSIVLPFNCSICHCNYTIKPGDNLFLISEVQNCSFQEVIDANPDINITLLFVDQTIFLPNACSSCNNASAIVPPVVDEKIETPLNLGAIVGGVVGGVLFLGLIVAGAILIAFLYLRKVKKTQSPNSLEYHKSPSTPGLTLTKSPSATLANSDYLEGVETLEKIGEGFYGCVYKGKWEGSIVAVKEIKEQEAFLAFLQEAALLKSLNHENVVRFYGVSKVDLGTVIVLEFVSHGNLLTYIHKNKNTLGVLNFNAMALDVAAGIKYVHSKGVIHRDLALRNLLLQILVDSDNNPKYVVKISDFGLSKQIESNTSYHIGPGESALPFRWTAPEVFEEGKFTKQSDVFSFGVILWELYSYGQTPYEGMGFKKVVDFVNSGKRLEKPGNCPGFIADLIDLCWSAKVSERPDMEQCFLKLETQLSQKSSAKTDHKTVVVDINGHDYRVAKPHTQH